MANCKLGALVVHGMGSQKNPHFADDMIKEVNSRVKDLGCKPDEICWKPVYWADVLQPQELSAAERRIRQLEVARRLWRLLFQMEPEPAYA